MKNLVMIAVILASSSVAFAQPALTHSSEPAAGADSYVAGGVAVGMIVQTGAYGALTLEGGRRIGRSPIWMHAMFGKGGMAGFDESTMSSNYLELRGGAEVRNCTSSKVLCAVAGADLGVRHENVAAASDQTNNTHGVIVPRVGLDFGSKDIRVRPGMELAISPLDGGRAIGLSLGVAYQF